MLFAQAHLAPALSLVLPEPGWHRLALTRLKTALGRQRRHRAVTDS